MALRVRGYSIESEGTSPEIPDEPNFFPFPPTFSGKGGKHDFRGGVEGSRIVPSITCSEIPRRTEVIAVVEHSHERLGLGPPLHREDPSIRAGGAIVSPKRLRFAAYECQHRFTGRIVYRRRVAPNLPTLKPCKQLGVVFVQVSREHDTGVEADGVAPSQVSVNRETPKVALHLPVTIGRDGIPLAESQRRIRPIADRRHRRFTCSEKTGQTLRQRAGLLPGRPSAAAEFVQFACVDLVNCALDEQGWRSKSPQTDDDAAGPAFWYDHQRLIDATFG